MAEMLAIPEGFVPVPVSRPVTDKLLMQAAAQPLAIPQGFQLVSPEKKQELAIPEGFQLVGQNPAPADVVEQPSVLGRAWDSVKSFATGEPSQLPAQYTDPQQFDNMMKAQGGDVSAIASNAVEVGKNIASGAINTTASMIKGQGLPGSRDPGAEPVERDIFTDYNDVLPKIPQMSDEEYSAWRRDAMTLVTMSSANPGLNANNSFDVIVPVLKQADLIRSGKAPAEKMEFKPRPDIQDTDIYKTGQKIEKWSQDTIAPDPKFQKTIAGKVSAGLGSTVPFLVSGVVAGPLSSAIAGMSSSTAESVDRAVAAGATKEQIADVARQGMFPGATEAVPIELLLERAPLPAAGKIVSAVGRVLQQAAAEGGQEAVQQAWQNIIAKFNYKPDQDITEGVAEAAGIGSIIGAGMQATTDVVSKAATKEETQQSDDMPPIPEGFTLDPSIQKTSRLPAEGSTGAAVEPVVSPTQVPVTQDGSEGQVSPPVTSLPSVSPEERAVLRRTSMPDEDIDLMSREEVAAKVGEARAAGIKINGAMVRAAEQYSPQSAVEPAVTQQAEPATEVVTEPAAAQEIPIPQPRPVDEAAIIQRMAPQQPVIAPEVLSDLERTVDQSVTEDQAQQADQAVAPVIPELQAAVSQSVAADQPVASQPAVAIPQQSAPSIPLVYPTALQQHAPIEVATPVAAVVPPQLSDPSISNSRDQALAQNISTAAQQVNPTPTDAQKIAGNYQKGHIKVSGIDVTLENPKGSVRSGVSTNGKQWQVDMPAHYGYIKRTTGADGDQVDTYIGDNPASKRVYVVDQKDIGTRLFDEHKAILGANSLTEARDLYARAFSDGQGADRIGAITPMSISEFKRWLAESDTTKPLAMGKSKVRTNDAGFPVDLKNNVKKPDSLIEFLSRKGGVREDRGELSVLGLRERKAGFVVGAGPLIRRNGMNPDMAREAAAEAGYLPMDSSLADFYDALDQDARSSRQSFSQYDDDHAEAWRNEQGAEERQADESRSADARQEVIDQLIASDFPIDGADNFINRVTKYVNDGSSFGDAVELSYLDILRESAESKLLDDNIPFFGDENNAAFAGTTPEGGTSDRATGEPTARPEEEIKAEGTGEVRPVRGEDRTEVESDRGREDGERSDRESSDQRENEGRVTEPRPVASWVVREKATGNVLLETFNKSTADAINKEKYDAVPIQEHLASLNKPAKAESPTEERGADDKPQLIIPGAERATDADMAQRKADAPLKPKVAQKDAGGLFSDAMDQKDLLDLSPNPVGWGEVEAEEAPRLSEADQKKLVDIVRKTAGITPEFMEKISIPAGSKALEAWGNTEASTAGGFYSPMRDVIALALDSAGEKTAQHEAFHRLQNLFLTDREHRVLKADEQRLRDMVAKGIAFGPDTAAKMSRKEVEAEAYAMWAVAKDSDPAPRINVIVRKAWTRLRDMLRRVKSFLNGRGFQTSEDIFGKAKRGDIAKRDKREAGSWDTQYSVVDGEQPFRQKTGMKIINSLAEVRKILDAKGNVFVRWSGGPKYDMKPGAKSRDYQSGELHDGLSALQIDADFEPSQIARYIRDYSYLRGGGYKNNAPHLYVGRSVGKDSDGAPTIQPEEYIGTISDKIVAFIDEESSVDRLSLMEQISNGKKALEYYKVNPPKYIPIWTPEVVNRLEADLAKLGGPVTGAVLDSDTVDYSIAERAPVDEPGIKPSDTPSEAIGTRISTVLDTASKALTAKAKSKGSKFDRSTQDDGEAFSDYSTRKIVDYLHPVKLMQESVGVDLNDLSDAYLTARLAEGTMRHEIHQIDEKYVAPAIEELASVGATVEDLHKFMYAMHAPERNRVVGLRNEEGSDLYKAVTDPTIRGASGMSTNDAKAIIQEMSKDREKFMAIRRAASNIRAMLDDGLKRQLSNGLINKETYDRLSTQWQHYVPLRAESDMDGKGGGMPSKSKGFDVRGDEFKGATGRFTAADNVVVYAVNSAEQSVLRGEKNKAATAALRFINQFDPKGESIAQVYWSDDPDQLGDITKAPPVYKRVLDKDGKVTSRKVNAFQMKDDVLAAKVGGKTYYMEFADPKVGLALKKMTFSELGVALKLVQKVSNWQSLVNTRANPAFIPINFMRDVQTGATLALGKDFSTREIAMMVGNIPKTWGALWRQARGKGGTGEWDVKLQDFISAGGKISFDQYNSIEETMKKLEKDLHRKTSDSKPAAAFRSFIKLVEDLNDTIENGMRLAVFDAAKNRGETSKRAAFMARDLTVDFQKKGEATPSMNALYTFFNASVQGNYNFARGLYKSRKIKVAMGALMTAGFAQHMWNLAMAGDDDDGENAYLKMLRNEPWRFERSMVFFLPDSKKYIMVPLGFGMNAFWNLGTQGAAVTTGDKDFLPAMLDSTRVAFDAFNPLGSGGWVSMAVPTIGDWAWDLGVNENFSGNPIYPTENKYDPAPPPNSEQAFNRTSPAFRWLAETTNKLTGGNAQEPGAIDVYPDSLEYLWGWFTGGVGRFTSQTYETAERGFNMEFEPKKTPFVRSFYGEVDDAGKKAEYYREREDIQYVKGKLKEYQEAGDEADINDFMERNDKKVQAIDAFDRTEKQRKKINKQRRRLEKDTRPQSEINADMKLLDQQEIEMMNEARKVYFETVLKH